MLWPADNEDMGGFPGGGSMFPGRGIERPARGIERPSQGIDRPASPAHPARESYYPVRPEQVLRRPGPENVRVVPSPVPKPEPVFAGRIRLDYADPARPGIVDVHKIKLGSKVTPVVIDRASAVQIGRNERQINLYRYHMVRPTASLEHLLRGHPVLQRALAGLVANPKSTLANFAFRQLLPARSPIACGRPRFTDTSGPRITRISARADAMGRIEVRGSRGVQLGVGDTQHNKFGFRVVEPELSLTNVLRDRPDLTVALATALGDPGNQAVRHSLESKLAGAYNRLGGRVSELRGQFEGGGLSVTGALAVQLGEYNSRVDKVALEVRKVILTGWGSAGALGLDQPEKGPGPGLVRNELDHRQRAGLTGPDVSASHLKLIVPSALRTMATAGVSAFAPGRQHLVLDVAAEISTALDTITPYERHSDRALKAPVLWHDGMFSLVTRSDSGPGDESVQVSLSVDLGRPGWAETRAGADRCPVLMVDAQLEQTEVQLGYQAAKAIGGPGVTAAWQGSPSAAGSPGQQQALPAGRPALGTGAGRASGTESPVAVVIVGSALLIAAGRRVLDADTLVRFARQVILRATHDGSPASAVLAMRLACALEIVVLLDVRLNGGIWIDVNPVTGEAAATLLIDGLPGDPGGTMRFLRS
jgi:hypothetical protein